jgi:hypothetical protein
MKATDFEFHHQTLVHQFIVGAAFLTYMLQNEDIVWRFVKNSTAPRELERFFFAVATLFIAVGAGISTWTRACHGPEYRTAVRPYRYLRHLRHLGDLLYAIGLGSLAPLWGFVILVAGEALRVSRLIRREDDHAENLQQQPLSAPPPLAPPVTKELDPVWRRAFRQEAVKCGLFLTMIVFVITLKDRVAEVLATTSFFIGLLLNATAFGDSSGIGRSS